AALEIIAPFQADDGDIWFPIQDLLELLARAGDPADAIGIAANVKSPHGRINDLLAIARVQVESGDREGARKTIDEAFRAVAAIPNESLWSTIHSGLRRLTKHGRRAQSLPLNFEMGFSAHQGVKYGVLKDIAIARASAGETAQALELVKSIPKDESFG